MSKSSRLNAALVAVLVGAALAGRAHADRFTVGLFVFGIVNALVALPGTAAIRVIAVGVAAAALWYGGNPFFPVLLAWLVWPPAFLVGWTLAREAENPSREGGPDRSQAGRRARIGIAAIIVAVTVASLAYRVIFASGLQQISALFVGIPAILALVVVFQVSPQSAIGIACKAVTVGLLVSATFLNEGILCVGMSAPLFYLVAVTVAFAAERRAARPADTIIPWSFLRSFP